jgi:hypothetical protein
MRSILWFNPLDPDPGSSLGFLRKDSWKYKYKTGSIKI